MSYSYVNGKIMPQSKACIPIHDLGFLRGFSVFDFFRTSSRIPVFLEAHLLRINKAISTLGLVWNLDDHKFTSIIKHLLDMVDYEEVGFKVIVTGGNSIDGFSPTTPNTYIIPIPIKLPTTEQVTNGIHLKIIPYSREFPRLKTTNYLEAIKYISKQDDKKPHFDDVLYKDGNLITESSRANFYIVKNNTLITNENKVLPGVTRLNLLDIAKKEMVVKIKNISVNDIFDAQECFVTSSTKRVLPVTKIDNKKIGDGQAGQNTKLLLEKFILFEDDYVIKNKNKFS